MITRSALCLTLKYQQASSPLSRSHKPHTSLLHEHLLLICVPNMHTISPFTSLSSQLECHSASAEQLHTPWVGSNTVRKAAQENASAVCAALGGCLVTVQGKSKSLLQASSCHRHKELAIQLAHTLGHELHARFTNGCTNRCSRQHSTIDIMARACRAMRTSLQHEGIVCMCVLQSWHTCGVVHGISEC